METTTTTLRPRMTHVAMLVPDIVQAVQGVAAVARKLDLPEATRAMVHLRASQINGCSVCVELHAPELEKAGASDAKVHAVAAWRDSPHFTDAERAALALTEALTRLADRPDPVPDEIWNEAARHYDEQGLAALIIEIGTINVWNRFNVATRQPAGQRW